jgi:uncharacterized protein (DUF2236 family)
LTRTLPQPAARTHRAAPECAGADDFDIRRHISGTGARLAGQANVVMQLGRPAVGYALMESTVHSGRITEHPFKRARTTFTFLAVALLGNEEDRRVYRGAVTRQHAQVRSTDASPVRYDAMDPQLQLWVAACLYYGTADVLERMHGPLPDRDADALYAHCARFGTSLQVRPEMWPATREDFAAYWQQSLAQVRIDEATRSYLLKIMGFGHLPRPVRRHLARRTLFFTTGFLPPVFRVQMGLSWSAQEQALFDAKLRRLGRLEARLPLSLRVFPFNALLRDLRFRVRTGRPLV